MATNFLPSVILLDRSMTAELAKISESRSLNRRERLSKTLRVSIPSPSEKHREQEEELPTKAGQQAAIM